MSTKILYDEIVLTLMFIIQSVVSEINNTYCSWLYIINIHYIFFGESIAQFIIQVLKST